MKLNSDLLNEVIADAKAVRETAVQTAISRLKETFEPTVRNLISQKLREEDGEEMDTEETPAPEMEAPAPEPAPEEEPVEEEMDDYTDETYDSVFEEEDYLDNGEEDEELLAQILDELDSEEMYSDLDDETIIPEEEDMEMDTTTEGDYGNDMSEEDLDQMIAELEDEMATEEESEEETVMESLRRRSKMKTGRKLTKESTFAWGDEDYDTQDDFGKVLSENRQLKRQLQGAKRHLQEAYKAIGTQKKAINEVNLLNSKLLFLTKITSKHQLTPQKQVKILEAFDRAQTVREVKLVYATISESLSKDSKAKARGITESASRPARSVGKTLNEQYEFAPKWKKLAGIL